MSNSALSSPLTLSVDAALCSPCGIGAAVALASPLQVGISSQTALSSPCEIGGGGVASALSAPLRISGGGNQVVTSLISIDGPQFSAALAQPMPMTDMSGTMALSAPLSLANPQALIAPYSVTITADGRDITRQIEDCVMVSSESALFDTVSLTLPDGSAWPLDAPPMLIVVTLPDAVHTFMVEEFTGDGPARTIWGRPLAAIYAEPWSAAGVWNERSSAAATASALAADIAGASWAGGNFPLPPRWEVDGTPAEALQKLAAAAGGIFVAASHTAGITIRKRWPIRPVDMSAATVQITRETAIELTSNKNESPQYGSVIVQGWSPDALLPRFDVEGSPVLGESAHVRLYWPGPDHPPLTKWITSGNAQQTATVSETVTETVVFTNGAASVEWPIWELLDYDWLGRDYGAINWLAGGYSPDLSLTTPGHGVARVTYRTQYDRWLLSAQEVETVLVGVDISQGAVAANVALASGGAAAGEVKEALLGDVASCVAHGAALLDDSRVRYTVQATLPRTAHIATGATAWVEDELTGLSGFGKITSVETRITSSRITQTLEVALC